MFGLGSLQFRILNLIYWYLFEICFFDACGFHLSQEILFNQFSDWDIDIIIPMGD